MSEPSGLRRVLELVAPTIRSSIAEGSFAPSSYASPLAVASLALETPFIIAVTATSNEAEHLSDALVAWLGEDAVALWPGWDTHPLERVSPDSQVMAQRALVRWRIREGAPPPVVVASVRAIAQELSPEVLRAPAVLRRGEEVNRDEFVQGLVATGYRREHLVEHRAEIAVRGGIVDVWPAQSDEPLRLDFFGDEIERLTVFDIATQRTTRDLDEAIVAPAREWLPGVESRQRAEALALSAPWASSTFDRLATGQLFDGMEGWMGLFVDEPRTLLDEAPAAHVVVVEPERVRSRLVELLSEERELTDVVAATWRASKDVPLLHREYDEVFRDRVDLALAPSVADRRVARTVDLSAGRPRRRGAHRRARARMGRVTTRGGAHLKRRRD